MQHLWPFCSADPWEAWGIELGFGVCVCVCVWETTEVWENKQMQTGQTDQCSAEFMQGTWWDSPKTGLTSRDTKTCRSPACVCVCVCVVCVCVCVCVWCGGGGVGGVGGGARGRGMWEKWSARLWKYECMWECARACVCVRWDTIACSIKPLTYIDHIHIKVPSLNPGPFSRHLVYWYKTVLWDINAQVKPIVFFLTHPGVKRRGITCYRHFDSVTDFTQYSSAMHCNHVLWCTIQQLIVCVIWTLHTVTYGSVPY